MYEAELDQRKTRCTYPDANPQEDAAFNNAAFEVRQMQTMIERTLAFHGEQAKAMGAVLTTNDLECVRESMIEAHYAQYWTEAATIEKPWQKVVEEIKLPTAN